MTDAHPSPQHFPSVAASVYGSDRRPHARLARRFDGTWVLRSVAALGVIHADELYRYADLMDRRGVAFAHLTNTAALEVPLKKLTPVDSAPTPTDTRPSHATVEAILRVDPRLGLTSGRHRPLLVRLRDADRLMQPSPTGKTACSFLVTDNPSATTASADVLILPFQHGVALYLQGANTPLCAYLALEHLRDVLEAIARYAKAHTTRTRRWSKAALSLPISPLRNALETAAHLPPHTLERVPPKGEAPIHALRETDTHLRTLEPGLHQVRIPVPHRALTACQLRGVAQASLLYADGTLQLGFDGAIYLNLVCETHLATLRARLLPDALWGEATHPAQRASYRQILQTLDVLAAHPTLAQLDVAVTGQSAEHNADIAILTQPDEAADVQIEAVSFEAHVRSEVAAVLLRQIAYTWLEERTECETFCAYARRVGATRFRAIHTSVSKP